LILKGNDIFDSLFDKLVFYLFIVFYRNAARDPLTFDEKKILISQIHKLPADKMDQVVEIVQAAIKPGQRSDGNEEIEIPLDELDTLTLRKLQRYVEVCQSFNLWTVYE
jgi:Bromodomain extra-terminal - transcription regulation